MAKRKRDNRRGESLVETLAAMLIISLTMLMLAGAIVTAARVNRKAANEIIQVTPPLDSAAYESDNGWFVEIHDNYGNTSELPVTLYKAKPEGGGENHVLYYYTVGS
ncbi:MAG: prepilin-type N-terminal cleavage/methylation domain-containing protein [Oscillibacter sp.]|nr:prepilin-type N-terminal cleavage/methylation domain-containing protein [Oscillibacter sp.]